MFLTETAITQWIAAQLVSRDDIQAPGSITLFPLCGDAGARQYYRVNTQPPLLAVAAPKTEGLSECAAYFSELSNKLRAAGVPTPQVLACDGDKNLMLIEDFGQQSYLDVLTDDSADILYSQALMVLLRLQQIPPHSVELPVYDRALLRQEMALFDEWFVSRLLGHTLTAQEKKMLNASYTFLENKALEQPQVLVHRDYHSRNILFREGEAPGIIDFQDAVWGPITYDVVSLLRDCYIAWTPEQIKRWLVTYGNMAIELGVMPPVNESRWQVWFDTMGLQRHIKVLGIFARLYLRDQKNRYLQDLPLVWEYTQSVAKQYPDMQPFAQWCETVLQPLVEQQDWYVNGNNAHKNKINTKEKEMRG